MNIALRLSLSVVVAAAAVAAAVAPAAAQPVQMRPVHPVVGAAESGFTPVSGFSSAPTAHLEMFTELAPAMPASARAALSRALQARGLTIAQASESYHQRGAVEHSRARLDAAVTPADAHPCDNDVCMDVYGSGLVVNEIDTQAYGGPFGPGGCTYGFAFLYKKGDFSTQYIEAESPKICAKSGQSGVYYAKFNAHNQGFPTHCPSESTAEAQWNYAPGRPEADVHS